jgi:hypothetical protein
MASLRTRERQIANLEGFDVVFLNPDGGDTHGNLQSVPPYTYDRAARGDWSVAEWKETRFKQ